MSTTASKFTTTLLQAVNASTEIWVDKNIADYWVDDDVESDAAGFFNVVNAGEDIFFMEQEIEVSTGYNAGQAYFEDIDGNQHEVVFLTAFNYVSLKNRPLTFNDIILNRLTT